MNTIEYLCGCKYPTHGFNAYFDHHCATCHTELWSQSIVDSLKAKLPAWHFEPYGEEGAAIACFPPNGTNAIAYRELSALAPITSVCGPLYVVTKLRDPRQTCAQPSHQQMKTLIVSTRPALNTITLRGKDYDRSPRTIVLTRETDSDWWGYPLANDKCPVLQWPKFAWERS